MGESNDRIAYTEKLAQNYNTALIAFSNLSGEIITRNYYEELAEEEKVRFYPFLALKSPDGRFRRVFRNIDSNEEFSENDLDIEDRTRLIMIVYTSES